MTVVVDSQRLREAGAHQLDHLATLTRNPIRFLAVHDQPVAEQLALPTPAQRRAFELLGQPIPLTLA
jgi:hypothetical protein